ncbi:MAG: endonuclease III [Deltaproteobacteria bacterium]|nr:endonuclease III [Deltaproteobacteria bacterium]
MTKAEKAKKIAKILGDLYPEPQVPLDHHDAFSLLVAVVLSAQTTDKKVNQVTPELFKAARTAQQLAALPVETIQAYIREVGLAPQKAKALKGLAEKIVEEHEGEVPFGYEALEALPGVGHKTASVVMAQWFKEPAFPVDTHIHRLAERWGLSNGKNVTQTEADLKKAFPKEQWNHLHLQIIYFGREHCPALRHEPSACPICSFASAKAKKARAKSKKR